MKSVIIPGLVALIAFGHAATIHAEGIPKTVFACSISNKTVSVTHADGRLTLVDALTQVQAEFEAAAARLDHGAVASINQQLHEIIGQHSGNPDAAEIVNRNQEMLRAIRRMYGLDGTRLPGVISDHRALISAFRERDAESAAAIGAGHAAKARSDLIATIRDCSRPT